MASGLAGMSARYDSMKLSNGYNTVDGEEIFFISNPGLGLWAYKGRFISQESASVLNSHVTAG